MPSDIHFVDQSALDQQSARKCLALFVSDLHLCEAMPVTTRAFLSFLKKTARQTERLYLLGDLFEYWAGDDDGEHPYHQEIIQALKGLAESGVRLFWIAGNRDFLVGSHFTEMTGIQHLADPCTQQLAGRSLLLSHGDILCTDDVNYMQFRQMVRQETWQQQFLQKPLSERKAIILGMRQASMKDQRQKSMMIMDVNQDAVTQVMQEHSCDILIHGHTHRTARHQEPSGIRFVLPDWDCEDAEDQRGGYLSLDADAQFRFHYFSKNTINPQYSGDMPAPD